MDFDLPPEDHPTRQRVRDWIAENPSPTGQQLAEAGYVVPHWPAPWGLNADPIDQLVIDDELSRARIRRPNNQIGIGWAAPTILLAGTQEHHERYLPKIFSGEEFWCQLFSETEAGSDLANLATRAERDGDEYVINGSKIWSSGAHHSKFGILIARTDPDQPKHKGISYFIMPMDAEGLSMSPIVDMTTAHSFNQVFFDNVRLPIANRIGDEGDGWRLAKVTLSNERVSLSSAGSMWGVGPSAELLIDLCRKQGGLADPLMRQRAVNVYIEAELLRLNRFRSLSATLQGKTPGAEASIQKIMADDHGQHVLALAKDLAGANGMLDGSGPSGHVPSAMRGGPTENNFDAQFPDVDPIWHFGYLFHPALTLGGGTFAVQRNIVAEHVLGLSREPNLERGMSWSQARKSTV
ncbi:MAG: acyl-CoA dehydrogenase family protein [Ilumatobacter sp.]|mgnify:CR=1 FL=1|nr:acyl-CoA dehydrogenase family protein [Ilumatobacter sp.]MDG2039478.1 acyl-CoA dehydrogenase family protein [Ilumatobacter sp.]